MSPSTGSSGESPPAAALGRRERKKQEVRRRIFESAFELFLEQGFEATTVEQIAEQADVGKGTVFNYFPHKTSFLAAVADDWTRRLTARYGPVESWRGNTRRKLERAFRFFVDMGVQNPALSRLAFAESLRHIGSAPVEDALTEQASVRAFLEVTRTVLREGQEKGEVRTDIEVEYAAMLVESAFFRTLARWLRVGGSVRALRTEIAAKLDIIFEGVGP